MVFLNYLKAARLRTLPLSLSGIVVGSFLAASQHAFDWKICVLALLTTVGFQVVSNFANDYGDGVKGTDKNRTGEARMVASGAITPKQMKRAIIYVASTTLLFALWLIYSAFGKENFGYSILFFCMGIGSIIAAIKYTVGEKAYGYSGFGDLFVFLFFGLLGVVGSYFLFTKSVEIQVFLPAMTIGFLSTAVLNLNNLRDCEEDSKANKRTLVVKMGVVKAKKYQYALILGAFLTALFYVSLQPYALQQYVFVFAFISLFKNLQTVRKTTNMALLDGELKKVALSTFLFAILFGLGQML